MRKCEVWVIEEIYVPTGERKPIEVKLNETFAKVLTEQFNERTNQVNFRYEYRKYTP